MKPVMEPWPDRLARLRNAADLSQAAVAAHFGIKPASVAQWEGTGGRITKPTVDKLVRLAALYGVTLEVLCGDDFSARAARIAATKKSGAVDPQSGRDIPDQRLDDQFFVLWGLLNDDIKIAALNLIRAAIYGTGARNIP